MRLSLAVLCLLTACSNPSALQEGRDAAALAPEARRERLGLSSTASPIAKVGNVLQLGAMTRQQAIALRAKKEAAS